MPFVKIEHVAGEFSAEQRADLGREITDLVAKAAGVPPTLVWIVFHEIPAENWMIGRKTIPELMGETGATKK
ncbi:tautomerase family protein [Methanosphaerula palustris]|uniref:4-oxalocrotonate tautomerase n=1 Tax=Methanosphaerula palustris (strain ATCC BAA-1556 / DSM 19958 / E1-9c) TaxID=521011 RepID=B8GES6_METPE|nr:4-oxalocrotonate tautomerase family protein [Methanosphaerula palustris]ACL17777.1 4-oxalocrotonate tautomerase [Methanosphaerula palustris E1-9c]